MFWLVAFGLTIIVASAVLWPMLRMDAASAPSRAEHDIEVYGAQLAELKSDVQRGVVLPDQAASAKAEIGRRLLRAAAEAKRFGLNGAASRHRIVRFSAVVFASVLFAGTIGFYAFIGAPNEPDRPLAARLSVDPAKADFPTLIAQAELRLRNDPDDGRGWDTLAPIYLRSGRPQDALTAVDNAIRLLGSTADREALRGEAQTQNASGDVTEDAKVSFATALRLDSSNVAARFYLALDLSQEGRFAEAASAWKALIDGGPADAPWMAAARMALDDANRSLAGSDGQVASSEPASGPSGEQIAAAESLSADDRKAMIDGMVSQLADRLKSAPNDADSWKRLIRSYTVLGERAKAHDAYRQAQAVFASGSRERGSIDDFAAALGLGESGITQ